MPLTYVRVKGKVDPLGTSLGGTEASYPSHIMIFCPTVTVWMISLSTYPGPMALSINFNVMVPEEVTWKVNVIFPVSQSASTATIDPGGGGITTWPMIPLG